MYNLEKKYYHISGQISKEGITCTDCGVKLDEDLMSNAPCIYSTAAQTIINPLGIRLQISVWNCQVDIEAFKRNNSRTTYHRIKTSAQAKKKLHRLAIEAVNQVGAINMSGIYSLSRELEQYIYELLDKNKIKFEEIHD